MGWVLKKLLPTFSMIILPLPKVLWASSVPPLSASQPSQHSVCAIRMTGKGIITGTIYFSLCFSFVSFYLSLPLSLYHYCLPRSRPSALSVQSGWPARGLLQVRFIYLCLSLVYLPLSLSLSISVSTSLSLSISVSPSLSLYLCLSMFLLKKITTSMLYLSLCLSLSVSVSLSLPLCFCLSISPSLFLSLSLPLLIISQHSVCAGWHAMPYR